MHDVTPLSTEHQSVGTHMIALGHKIYVDTQAGYFVFRRNSLHKHERMANFLAWIDTTHQDVPRPGKITYEVRGRLHTGETLPNIPVTKSELQNGTFLWRWSKIGEPGHQAKCEMGHKLRTGAAIRLYTEYLLTQCT